MITTLAKEFKERVKQLKADHKEEYLCFAIAEEMFMNQINYKKTTLLRYVFIDGSQCEYCNNGQWNEDISYNLN